ncbi:hypothetical protein [Muricoccus pecuniae]|uniref:Uncharacterized protein n=1 Tax=Muricoccus pecuniae TaxID=693023 RepID=A0A840YMS5_9PROT|nr:hypothetical protein [Roseomonas pecuniae]MBB5696054.1 hypothetical protein [Roseomonas pecuniae]
MIRPAVLVAALALSACAGHTPPPACRGEMFSLNPPQMASATPQAGAGLMPAVAP